MTAGSVTRDRRRDDVVEAVWRVLDRDGFVGLSMRTVAAEMGATTGTVTHYFRTKRELTAAALDLLAQRSAERERRAARGPRDALRAALLDMLPLDDASRTATRIWVSSWDAALADSAYMSDHAARYRASREKIAELVRDSLGDTETNALGDTDTDTDAAPTRTDATLAAERLHALVLGLSVQAALDPAAYPPERLIAVVDAAIAGSLA